MVAEPLLETAGGLQSRYSDEPTYKKIRKKLPQRHGGHREALKTVFSSVVSVSLWFNEVAVVFYLLTLQPSCWNPLTTLSAMPPEASAKLVIFRS